jgi:hypothetical protein
MVVRFQLKLSGSSLKLTFINLLSKLTQEFHLSTVNVLLNLIFKGTLDRTSATTTCLVLVTRVNSANVLDEGLRIRGREHQMNSKVKVR